MHELSFSAFLVSPRSVHFLLCKFFFWLSWHIDTCFCHGLQLSSRMNLKLPLPPEQDIFNGETTMVHIFCQQRVKEIHCANSSGKCSRLLISANSKMAFCELRMLYFGFVGGISRCILFSVPREGIFVTRME